MMHSYISEPYIEYMHLALTHVPDYESSTQLHPLRAGQMQLRCQT